MALLEIFSFLLYKTGPVNNERGQFFLDCSVQKYDECITYYILQSRNVQNSVILLSINHFYFFKIINPYFTFLHANLLQALYIIYYNCSFFASEIYSNKDVFGHCNPTQMIAIVKCTKCTKMTLDAWTRVHQMNIITFTKCDK